MHSRMVSTQRRPICERPSHAFFLPLALALLVSSQGCLTNRSSKERPSEQQTQQNGESSQKQTAGSPQGEPHSSSAADSPDKALDRPAEPGKRAESGQTASSPSEEPSLERRQLDDREITMAVETRLAKDPEVDANMVDTKVVNGVVTLSGTVRTLAAHARALELVQTVRGVQAVLDHLELKRIERPDLQVGKDIAEAFELNPTLNGLPLQAVVNEGIVLLTGKVGALAQKEIALEAVRQIPGVRRIDDKITLEFHVGEIQDTEIERMVRQRLSSDVRVEVEPIDVTVTQGKVTLGGKVGSLAESQIATRLAWVDGVRQVMNELEIDPALLDAMERVSLHKTVPPQELEENVKAALRQDPRVKEKNVEVAVAGGVVTLNGRVSSLAAKVAAEEDARFVRGVWQVKNNLEISPPEEVQDKRVESYVRTALTLDPVIEQEEITQIIVKDGNVRLLGSVDSERERLRAAEVAGDVRGVLSVTNELRVVRDFPQLEKTDSEIKEDVEDQLFWSPFVSANEVTVNVANGIVTLEGRVDSWFEKEKARENAYEAGAWIVDDKISVGAEG